MSLIVLSNTSFNESEDNLPRVGGIKTPYSFTNTLQTPIVIPPDSEVALQSIKLNLDGDFEVRNWNDTMYQYIGKRVDEDVADYFDSINESTRYPAKITVERGTYNAEEFVDKLEEAMNRGLYHPNFQGLANASVQRSASNASFDGYNLTYDRSATASGNNRPGDEDVQFATEDSNGWSYDGTTNFRFTKTSGNGSLYPRAFAQFTNAPCDLADGDLEVDFANASSWFVGLSRYCNPDFEFVDENGTFITRDFTEPEYFNSNGFLGFYDYLACAFYDETNASHTLRLFHAVKSDDNENPQLEMQEVRYWGFTGANFTAPYDLTTNASGYSRVHFETSGEAVKLKLSVAGASQIVVTTPTLGTPTGKNNYFKPIAQTCAYLYPKMEIKDTVNDGDAQNQYLDFHEYKCKNDLTGFKYNGLDESKSIQLPLRERLINFDWYQTMINIGQVGKLKEVDFRVFNDMSAGTAAHTFIETEHGKIAQEYAPVPIVGESNRYIPSDFANMRYVLGFDDNAKDQPTSKNGSAVTFTSDQTPKTISNQSVFVRLTSLTQRSVNGVTGNESKIIYHCPRFDNAGNQVGGLFFEPGEKTYLDIGNIAETPINTFSVDLVDNKERFIKSAIGSTTICLHIRKKQKH
jgi:hypothetical protein